LQRVAVEIKNYQPECELQNTNDLNRLLQESGTLTKDAYRARAPTQQVHDGKEISSADTETIVNGGRAKRRNRRQTVRADHHTVAKHRKQLSEIQKY
jgi:hypothetical protein